MLGLFWVVEDRGKAARIAHAVPMEPAVPYGDMLTVDAGHFAFWSELACRGPHLLRAAGIPIAPLWSYGKILTVLTTEVLPEEEDEEEKLEKSWTPTFRS